MRSLLSCLSIFALLLVATSVQAQCQSVCQPMPLSTGVQTHSTFYSPAFSRTEYPNSAPMVSQPIPTRSIEMGIVTSNQTSCSNSIVTYPTFTVSPVTTNYVPNFAQPIQYRATPTTYSWNNRFYGGGCANGMCPYRN